MPAGDRHADTFPCCEVISAQSGTCNPLCLSTWTMRTAATKIAEGCRNVTEDLYATNVSNEIRVSFRHSVYSAGKADSIR